MKIKNIFIISLCLLAAFSSSSCQDGDWDKEIPLDYTLWNDTITEHNVKTIAELKAEYKSAISNSSFSLVDKDYQIKAWITINDEGGNLSQQLIIQDATGYFIIGITEDSMYSYARPGQVILLNLKGLYIGGYGMNGQIGRPSMSSTTQAQRIGRMTRYDWYNHVKFLNEKHELDAAVKFNPNMNMDTESNKLVYVEGYFNDADGTASLADPTLADGGNAVNRNFRTVDGQTVTIRTSCYSDFGAMPMPRGKVRVTGAAIRYNTSSWQIQMRTEADIEIID